MTLEAQPDIDFERTQEAARRAKRMRRGLSARLRGILRGVSSRFSSSLTRRIVVLNLGGLVALLVGFLYLNQFREGLIDARVQSLQTQGEIIAAAIAASATVDTDSITIDPEKLLQLAPGRKLWARRRIRRRRWSSRSIPNASGPCCAGWSRRPARARGSTIATAICCSIRAR